MRDGRSGDRVLDRLVRRLDRCGHAGAGGHHPAGRHLDPGQIGEDLADPRHRDMVLRGQIGGQHRDRRSVHRRRRHSCRRKSPGPRPAAGAGQQVQQIRGDPDPDLGHIEDLPHDRIAGRPGRRIEAVITG